MKAYCGLNIDCLTYTGKQVSRLCGGQQLQFTLALLFSNNNKNLQTVFIYKQLTLFLLQQLQVGRDKMHACSKYNYFMSVMRFSFTLFSPRLCLQCRALESLCLSQATASTKPREKAKDNVTLRPQLGREPSLKHYSNSDSHEVTISIPMCSAPSNQREKI